MQRSLTVRFAALLLGLAAGLGTAMTVVASSGSAPPAPGLSTLQPGPHGYFEYTLAPGATVQGTAEVHNLTAAPADYLISVVDATTSEITGVAYGQPRHPQQGVAAWVRLPVGQVTVPAHGITPVTFQLTVPKATAVGDYVAAVAVQSPAPTVVQPATSGGPGVHLITTTRVLMAIVVHVPGPAVMAFTLGRPSVQLQDQVRQILVIPMHDAGNVLTKPYLSGKVTPCSGGKAVLVLDRQLDTFVPHTSISYPWSLNGKVLSAGCYQVHMSIGVGGQKLAGFAGTMVVGQAATRIRPAQPSVQQAALPLWFLIVVGGSLIAVIIATLLLLRGRRERRLLLARLAAAQTQGRTRLKPGGWLRHGPLRPGTPRWLPVCWLALALGGGALARMGLPLPAIAAAVAVALAVITGPFLNPVRLARKIELGSGHISYTGAWGRRRAFSVGQLDRAVSHRLQYLVRTGPKALSRPTQVYFLDHQGRLCFRLDLASWGEEDLKAVLTHCHLPLRGGGLRVSVKEFHELYPHSLRSYQRIGSMRSIQMLGLSMSVLAAGGLTAFALAAGGIRPGW